MKRLLNVFLIFVLALTAASIVSAEEREDRPNRDPDGVFWNPGEEQFEAWRVIDNVEEGAVLRFWPWALTPDFEDYLNQIIANFEATYPGVTVLLEGQPAAGARDNIRNSFGAGNPADIINMSDGWVAEFAEAGVLLNMDEAIGEAYPEIREQYVDGAWQKVTFEGTTYYVPWYLSLSNAMAVNGLIFDELGLTEDDLPATWNEAYAFAERIREESDGRYHAFSFPWGELAGLGVLNAFVGEGVPIFNEDRTEVIFNQSPEAVAVMDAYKTMLDNDHIPRGSLRDDVRRMIDRFSEGEILLLMTGPQLFRLIEENNPEVYDSLFLVNSIVGEANIRIIGGVQTLAIPASTEFPNAAVAFATFVTNPDVQTAFSREVPIFSSNLVSYEDPFFQTDGEQLTDSLRPLAGEYFSTATDAGILDFPSLSEVEQIVVGEFQAALLGVKSSQEALDDMASRINDILARDR
ncbi:MAG: sugar ABC transporter substrate-binding protein [Anaerolineaceae bacterium]|nr:MAG: sugar ABC transporter substrate-binding protein [Anaerolineaceae bacterium]